MSGKRCAMTAEPWGPTHRVSRNRSTGRHEIQLNSGAYDGARRELSGEKPEEY